jgi:hypothetical protein
MSKWFVRSVFIIILISNIGVITAQNNVNLFFISPSSPVNGTVNEQLLISVGVGVENSDIGAVLYVVVSPDNDLYSNTLNCSKKTNIPASASSQHTLTATIPAANAPQSAQYTIWAVLVPFDSGACPPAASYPNDSVSYGIHWFPKNELDSDGDGVPDAVDTCPDEGDNGYGVDSDGCPLSESTPDRDGDGIPDSEDTCPDEGDGGYGLDPDGCPLPNPWIPTPYDFVLLSQIAYTSNPLSTSFNVALQKRGWEYFDQSSADGNDDLTGYFAVAYLHPLTHQIAIAHRGTNFGGNIISKFGDVTQDLSLLILDFNPNNPQFNSARLFYLLVKNEMAARGISDYRIHHTGHSLGAALAEGMVGCGYGDEGTTFDSPGAFNLVLNQWCGIPANTNVTTYMSSPNAVNTASPHVGMVILVEDKWYNNSKTNRRASFNIPLRLTAFREAVWDDYTDLLGPSFWRIAEGIKEEDWLLVIGELTSEPTVIMGGLLVNYGNYTLVAHDLQVNFADTFSKEQDGAIPTGSRVVHDVASWPVTIPWGFGNFLFPLETCGDFYCEEIRSLIGNPFSIFDSLSANTANNLTSNSFNSIENEISITLQDINYGLIEFVQPAYPLAHDVIVDIHVIDTAYSDAINEIANWLETTSASRVQVVSGNIVIQTFTDDANALRSIANNDSNVVINVSLAAIENQMLGADWRDEVNKSVLIVAENLPDNFDANQVRITQELAFVVDPVNLHALISTNDANIMDGYELLASGAWGSTIFTDTPEQIADSVFEMMTDILKVIEVRVDIKPGNSQNSVNIDANGVIPVAIMGHSELDVTTILPETLNLSGMSVAILGNGRYHVQHRDINRDGFMDAVYHFETALRRLDWIVNNTIYLEGQTVAGETIVGRDYINSVPSDNDEIIESQIVSSSVFTTICDSINWQLSVTGIGEPMNNVQSCSFAQGFSMRYISPDMTERSIQLLQNHGVIAAIEVMGQLNHELTICFPNAGQHIAYFDTDHRTNSVQWLDVSSNNGQICGKINNIGIVALTEEGFSPRR